MTGVDIHCNVVVGADGLANGSDPFSVRARDAVVRHLVVAGLLGEPLAGVVAEALGQLDGIVRRLLQAGPSDRLVHPDLVTDTPPEQSPGRQAGSLPGDIPERMLHEVWGPIGRSGRGQWICMSAECARRSGATRTNLGGSGPSTARAIRAIPTSTGLACPALRLVRRTPASPP